MKVSVITTLYNYRRYIGECIQSFFEQDFNDSEIVIVDDCSTDNPFEVISKFNSSRIQYIYLPGRIDYGSDSERSNYGNVKNVGIKKARGEILVMLDADDLLLKNGISIRYEKLQQGFDFVHGPCLRMESNQTYLRDPMWDKWLKTKDPKWVHAQGFAVRKSVHEKIGLYDDSFYANDREMICRIFNAGMRIGEVQEDVAIYRIHEKQMSRKRRAHTAEYKELERMRMREVLLARKSGDFSGLEMLDVA